MYEWTSENMDKIKKIDKWKINQSWNLRETLCYRGMTKSNLRKLLL